MQAVRLREGDRASFTFIITGVPRAAGSWIY
jgi:hypothetical protein